MRPGRAAGIEEGEAGGAVLFILDQFSVRVGELATRRQCDFQKSGAVVVLERNGVGGELHAGMSDGLYRLEDGEIPEADILRMIAAPRATGGDHVVYRRVIARDAAIGANAALVLER
jgi:hypothetical protein